MDIIEFNYRIRDLIRSISQGLNQTLRVIIDSYGVTMVQMQVLVELDRCEICTIGDLADAIGSAPGNASAMCKTLEKKKLVTRTRNPEDERIVFVSLTEQGSDLLRGIEEELAASCNPLLAEYSDADFEVIINGMSKLQDVVNRLQSRR
ncbi:MAG: winged helix-turn-helix transcriptional regulator [Firmicutes bacterium]|nr:winged helix-turn-helix transcriptional regulator [Bacillota bacterium]